MLFTIPQKRTPEVTESSILQERRRAPRQDCFLKVEYATCGRGHIESETKALNISRGGIRLTISRIVKIGALVKLRIYSSDGGIVLRHGVVRWQRHTHYKPFLFRDSGIEFLAS